MTRTLPRPLAGVLVAMAMVSILAGCTATGTGGATGSPAASPSGDATSACPTAQPPVLGAGETRTVSIATDKGPIVIKLEADLSPIATGNFAALAACGYYDGVVFHRLVPGFVIQGGDPTGTGTGGPGYTIKDELVRALYERGTVAMARTNAPDSVGSQFFIVLDDAAAGPLSSFNTYQIIGTVTEGMETVDAIAAMPNSGDPNNEAIDPVAMTTVTVANP